VLEAKRKDYKKELDELDKNVENKEKDIAAKAKLIETKMKEIDKLNKELSRIEEDAKKEQNTTNIDVNINKLRRLNKEKEDECRGLRSEWERKEKDYLNLEQESNGMDEVIRKQRNEVIVLEQKKLRLQANTGIHEKEIKVIEINLKNLGNEMNKLNALLKSHKTSKVKLEQDNYNIEKEFGQRLKDLEIETTSLEAKAQDLKEEKADLLTQIVEAERQILLWERKIELEKKMQQEIKPDFEKGSIQKMKEDIHSMKLKYEDLKRVK